MTNRIQTPAEKAFLQAAANLAAELVVHYPAPIDTKEAWKDILGIMHRANAVVHYVQQTRAALQVAKSPRAKPGYAQWDEVRKNKHREYARQYYHKNKPKPNN